MLEIFTTTYIIAAVFAFILRVLILRRHPPRHSWLETLRQAFVSFLLVSGSAPLATYLHIPVAFALPIAALIALVGAENFLLFLMRILYTISPGKFKEVIADEITRQEIRNLENLRDSLTDEDADRREQIQREIDLKKAELSYNK